MQSNWTFWIDVGGTFTDCIGRDPRGNIHRIKVLSSDTSPIIAIRELMQLPDHTPIGKVSVSLGTTRGTNALLQRNGQPVAMLITKGFSDLLDIGTQARPDLFALNIQKHKPLHNHVIEINERLDANGQVLEALDLHQVQTQLGQLKERGYKSLAVCLLHSYLNDDHEQQIAKLAHEMGFDQVSVSSELSPTIKALDRFDTAVIDAYLSPVIRHYMANLRKSLGAIKVMTSAGALVDSEIFAGKDSLLSGPAGGVVGFAHAAEQAGFQQAIGFDMGGTSTDVSRFDGRYEYQYAGEIDGIRVVTPMLAIETVAAGGGSICDFDGQRLTVGPDSAGAHPGPACYGKDGPLAITDINLFNGKIDPARFPFALDVNAVTLKLQALRDRMDQNMSLHQIADGFTRVANLKMASAIKRISTARGYDPTDHVLVAFGGAAAQHACAIARSLHIREILLHPLAGVLSAHGISMANVKRFAEKTILKPLNEQTLKTLQTTVKQLAKTLYEQVLAEGVAPSDIDEPMQLLDLRYAGQQTAITIAKPADGAWAGAFEQMHTQLYGHAHLDREIQIVTLRVEVTGNMPKPVTLTQKSVNRRPKPARMSTVYFDALPHDTACFERADLQPGDRLIGPAIIHEDLSTIGIDPGWTATVNEQFDLILNDQSPHLQDLDQTTQCDPIRLELFNNHFTHIAVQMGLTLQKTSLSVNVKERLDFSCAILDSHGDLVVNAPHIPVHLGAMGATVRGLLEHVSDIRPGDSYLSNNPDLGGSHLPDLTVITPVFDPTGKQLQFFTASRAHHAEIGGKRPGSTFPFAKNLAEEGVVFSNLRLMREGHFDETSLRNTLTSGAYPSRAPDENIADIRAALAANTLGSRELQSLIAMHSWPVVHAYMGHIRDAASKQCQAAISRIIDGQYRFEDKLDDGSPLAVAIDIHGDKMAVDFTGTGPVNDNAFNANRAVVESAILYCMRCIINEDIPLNGGVMEPIQIILPQCMLNPPKCDDPTQHAAVAAGNVELSQRVVDMFFGALGIMAGSQGTMNNFIFGNQQFGYYETICGGSGGGPDFDGTDAVHTHMTNTRMTDVEVFETQYPARVRQFAIRQDSGGDGLHRGGNGVTREIEFLKSLDVSMLTQHRTYPPKGIAGGSPAKCGGNTLKRENESTLIDLGPLVQVRVEAHDVLTIQTPGGGGYGQANGR
ncbi:MAG TPA: hydantoinase [Phycisphaerales bacterium]|nr:hydantoinase [Phycisphaerales bacterium]